MEQAETKASKHIKVEHMGILTQENQCWKAKYMTKMIWQRIRGMRTHTHTAYIHRGGETIRHRCSTLGQVITQAGSTGGRGSEGPGMKEKGEC